MDLDTKRVLSIQSHVVSGYVGNKSATFPLQLLGYHVDPLNTVQFSNHTGYTTFTGQRFEGSDLEEIIHGLEINGFLKDYTHVLTGYIGRLSAIQAVMGLLLRIKEVNPNSFIVVDPVLGDDDKLYVPSDLVPYYAEKLCKLAHVITPNAYEAGWLTQIHISDEDSALRAILKLHELGTPFVVITSADLAKASSNLTLFGSFQPNPSQPMQTYKFKIVFPKRDTRFTGTGDLFAALLLAHMGNCISVPSSSYASLSPEQVKIVFDGFTRACEFALGSMQAVLEKTVAFPPRLGHQELRIIESQKDICNAPVSFKAQLISST